MKILDCRSRRIFRSAHKEDLDAESVNGGVHNNGTFVLVGDNGTIIKTTDGLQWTPITSSPTASALNRIAFGNNLYVAVGDDGVFTSSDTISWIPRQAVGVSSVVDVAFFGGRFVAIAAFDTLTSTDGISWTISDLDFVNGSPYANAICGGMNGFKVVCDDGEAFSSFNGRDFVRISLNTTSNVNDVAYGGGIYVAVGDRGLIRTFQSPPAVPEISVQQPTGSELEDGRSKSNFGPVKLRKSSKVKTFTIKNIGTADLSGLTIQKTGKGAKDFNISGPTQSSIAPGVSATFKVTFKPTAKGLRKAGVVIQNNDLDENPFDFEISGLGVK